MKVLVDKVVSESKYKVQGILILSLEEGETLGDVKNKYEKIKEPKYSYPVTINKCIVDGVDYEGNMARMGWYKLCELLPT